MRKLIVVVSAVAAIALALAFLGVWLFGHSDETAQATQVQGPVEEGFDMAPLAQVADLKKLAFDPIGITSGDDIDVSIEYWFQIQTVLHNNGPEPFVPAWDITYCYPPPGGSCSYHCQGGEIITRNGAVIDPNCLPSTVYYADGNAGEWLDVHINLEPEMSIPMEV